MLRCNMKHFSQSLKTGLEDLLADLWHARRVGDLGRLAFLCYYEVRRWARVAEEPELAEHASVLVTRSPYADRRSFMVDVDQVITELERLHEGHSSGSWSMPGNAPAGGRDTLAWRMPATSSAEPHA
jgi:hypothetical protein